MSAKQTAQQVPGVFCTECGLPNRLTLFLLRQYVATDEYSGFYCGNCGSRNEFLDSVIEYIKEL